MYEELRMKKKMPEEENDRDSITDGEFLQPRTPPPPYAKPDKSNKTAKTEDTTKAKGEDDSIDEGDYLPPR